MKPSRSGYSGRKDNMKNYKRMTITELREAAFATGINPIGMSKPQLVRWLEGTERAKAMTMDELLEHIKSRNAEG